MNKLYAFTLGMIAFGNCHAQSSSELIDQIFNDLGTPENYSNASIAGD